MIDWILLIGITGAAAVIVGKKIKDWKAGKSGCGCNCGCSGCCGCEKENG